MTLNSRLLPILLVPVLVAPCLALAAPAYTVTPLISDPMILYRDPGATVGSVSTINNWGQSVGLTTLPGESGGDASVWTNGSITRLQLNDSAQGVRYAQGLAINDSGTVLAQSCGDVTCKLVTIANGKVSSMPGLPDASYARAYGMNNQGQVVGTSYVPVKNSQYGEEWHAFLYTPNSGTVDLGTLGGGGSYAVAVNNSGVVVGDTTYGDTENRHAFMYSDGVMRDLGTLGGANSDVSAINDSGVAVGSSELASGGSVAVMYKDGAIIELGNPSLPCNGGCWDGSAASSINNAGKVVGYTTEFNGQWLEPFLFTDGVMHNLNTMIAPGWDLSFALAINDNDQILALGYSPDSVYQYVLLTPTGANLPAGPGISPVPEPRQAASLLAGVVLLGFFAGRQRRLAPDQRICV